jgi:hypothetical protein
MTTKKAKSRKRTAEKSDPGIRDERGRFKPGFSGYPPGRPPVPPEVREAARALGPEAIERLAHWMRSNDPTASIPAAKLLLERGYGKSVQPIAGGGSLVNINLPSPGSTITNSSDVNALYRAMLGDLTIDVSSVRIEPQALLPLIEAPVITPMEHDNVVSPPLASIREPSPEPETPGSNVVDIWSKLGGTS